MIERSKEQVVEFFAYETVGMSVGHAAAIPVVDAGGLRVMFPSEAERDRFLAMSPAEREAFIKEAAENQ